MCVCVAKDALHSLFDPYPSLCGFLLLKGSISGSKSLFFMQPSHSSALLADTEFSQNSGLQSRLTTFDEHHTIVHTSRNTQTKQAEAGNESIYEIKAAWETLNMYRWDADEDGVKKSQREWCEGWR